MEIKKDPILITGVPRSGTSMVAGIVDICGAFGGKVVKDVPARKKGRSAMYENTVIRDQLVKPYLKGIGVDPLGQYPLPDTWDIPFNPQAWAAKVKGVMLEQGYTGGPWFYKGAKMTLTWPMWHYAFPDAKWVIVRRRSTDIVDSCMKTSFMRAYDNEAGWRHYIREHERRFTQMYEAGLNVHVVWPERMMKGDYEQMYQLIDWLRLEWRSQEVMNYIEPKLWKAKKKEGIV